MMNPKAIRRLCQCCGRAILANTGVIAHHGYQRPSGWQQQVGSCMGSRHLPFEASRDRLAYLIKIIERELTTALDREQEIANETAPLQFHYREHRRVHGPIELHRYVETTREDFDAVREAYKVEMLRRSIHTFNDLKNSVASDIAYRIKKIRTELEAQQKRFEGWTQLEEWTGSAWQKLAREQVSA